jgi:hypothetical protein
MFVRSPKSRRPPQRHLLLALPLLWSCAVVAGELQNVAELEAVARAEAIELLPALTAKQRLQVGPLPPQIQLPRCEIPVKPARAPGLQSSGRVLIELRCDGRSPWHIYVPAKIIGTTQVVVAAHALIAGTVLAAKDIAVEQHDLAALPPGYLDRRRRRHQRADGGPGADRRPRQSTREGRQSVLRQSGRGHRPLCAGRGNYFLIALK